MGSGLCKRNLKETPRTPPGVDGLCRKIVFGYAKQWTRYSDKSPKSGGKKAKYNKSRKKKPIISGPFPADPDRLEGDKWRYVILTRLDAEPPPERPPRTKRRRPRQETVDGGGGGSIRWGSSRRKLSSGRGGHGRPPKAGRRTDADRDVSAAELMSLVMDAYRRGPVGRRLPPWTPNDPFRGDAGEQFGAAGQAVDECPRRWTRSSASAVVGGMATSKRIVDHRNGFFVSVGRAKAMAHVLLP